MKRIMKTLLLFLILLPIAFSSVDAQLQSDVSDSVWAIVMPMSASHDIDMGQALLGTSKDSVIIDIVSNTGSWKFRVDSVYFRGTDAIAFGFVSGLPPYILESGTSRSAELVFKPVRVGIHNAELVIITQADTLIQKITGEGVQPQLQAAADIIDFGLVTLGGSKDTLGAITIKNIGNLPILITGTKHNKPNDVDFTTISGGGSFTLQPDSSHKMDLKFKPSDVGRTSGTLEFYYDGLGSPAVVSLYGEGVKNLPVIKANIKEINNLVCDNQSTNMVEISNIGNSILEITGINFNGINKSDFEINETFPVDIAPDSSKIINFNFKTSSIGEKSAIMEIKRIADPDSIYTLDIIARKDSISIYSNDSIINFGVFCPNTLRDTLITIKNTGNLPTSCDISTTSNLLINLNHISIDSNKSLQIPVRFNGIAQNGKFNEEITVTDSICNRIVKINITGEISTPAIQADNISIKAKVGWYRESQLIIKNISGWDVTIANAPIINPPFSIVGNPFPMLIPKYSQSAITIRYSPVDNTPLTIQLTFNTEPCNVNYLVDIAGTPYISQVETLIWLPDTTGNIGTTNFCIPLKVLKDTNLVLDVPLSYKAEIRYDASAFLPDNINSIIESGDRVIQLSGDSIRLSGNVTEIGNFCGTVMLANQDRTFLRITKFEWNNPNIERNTKDGSLTVAGLCQRTISKIISFSPLLMEIIPNPSNELSVISYKLSEEGNVKLTLVSCLGQEVAVLVNENQKAGEHSYQLSVMSYQLSSGIYDVVLTANGEVVNCMLRVVK